MPKDSIALQRQAFESGWKTNSIQPHTPALQKAMESDWILYLVHKEKYVDECVKSDFAEAHDDLYA